MSDNPTTATNEPDASGSSGTKRNVIIAVIAAIVLIGLIFVFTRSDDDADDAADELVVDDDATEEEELEEDAPEEEELEEETDESEEATDEDADAPDDTDDTDEPGDIPADGPTIDVASFNFPESEILAEVYAQALEDAGYPVERSLNLGARELIYPELLDGGLDLLPEYLGSALVVWFEQDPPGSIDDGFEALSQAFAADGISVLAPAPAENNQAFVVTADFAAANGLVGIGDLAGAGAITFAGPPECEARDTCYQGLVDLYGLDNVTFTSIQEAAARLAALDAGDSEVILLFSTDPPLAGDAYVVLEDTEGMLPPENITPVVSDEALDAYGDALRGLLDRITAAITTDALQQMNADASEGLSAAEIATAWLADTQ